MNLVSSAEHNHKKIAIIDYGLGNLFSVNQAFKFLGADSCITDDINAIKTADAIVLPGVGAFGQAMENLRKKDLTGVIVDSIQQKKQFLGVCLGLQLLFDESEEFGSHKGLGLISGQIKKFPSQHNQTQLRVPQIAWNRVQSANSELWNNSCMAGVEPGSYVYFVHSYYTDVTNESDRVCMTSYEGFEYCSAISRDNIFAVQFHPEKSAQIGALIFNNWLKKIN